MAEVRGKILCVDDEPNISRALQWLLQKDFDVMTANSGKEALALVDENDFDVLISDQRMPMMTGVEFFREARKISPRSIRILLTGYSDLQAVLRSVNEGEIYRFINKPWNISELPKVVEQAVHVAQTQPVVLPEPELTEEMPLMIEGDESVLLIDDDPRVRGLVREAIGDEVRLNHALNLAEAITILNEQRVSVIISETMVGSVDATRLINIMKQKHPEIVSVMLSTQSDAEVVSSLINEGQIFRFVPKPIRSGYLKLVINSALVKHRRLIETPLLTARFTVDPMTDAKLASLIADVERIAKQSEVRASSELSVPPRVGIEIKLPQAAPVSPAPAAGPAGAPAESLFARVGKSFRKLLG